MPGNEAFYYIHEQRELQGAVLTQVDDFAIRGSADL